MSVATYEREGDEGYIPRGDQILIKYAIQIIHDGLAAGRQSSSNTPDGGGHAPDSWLQEDWLVHGGCVLRHIGQLIKRRLGYGKDDGEDHVTRAGVRALMMVVCILEERKRCQSSDTTPNRTI